MLNIMNKKYRNIEIVKVAQIVMWYCYILRSTDEKYRRRTYNGSTNDLSVITLRVMTKFLSQVEVDYWMLDYYQM